MRQSPKLIMQNKIHYRDRDLIGFKKHLVHVHKISNVCYRVGKKGNQIILKRVKFAASSINNEQYKVL